MKIGERRLLGKGERQSGYSCVAFVDYRSSQINILLHMLATLQGRHNSADQRFYCVYDARQCWVGRERIGERVKVYI